MESGGDMIVMMPEYQVEDLLEELVYYFDALCDQEQLKTILEASYHRFTDLENWGHKFARDSSGKLMSIPQRGLKRQPYGHLGGNQQGLG